MSITAVVLNHSPVLKFRLIHPKLIFTLLPRPQLDEIQQGLLDNAIPTEELVIALKVPALMDSMQFYQGFSERLIDFIDLTVDKCTAD